MELVTPDPAPAGLRSDAGVTGWFDASPIALAVLDLDGRHRFANPAYLSLLGYSRGELMERSLRDLVHPDHRDAAIDSLVEPFATGRHRHDTETRLIRRDGTPLPARVHATPAVDREGPSRTIHIAVLDTSAQRRRENELARRLADQRAGSAAAADRLARAVAEPLDRLRHHLDELVSTGDPTVMALSSTLTATVEEIERAVAELTAPAP